MSDYTPTMREVEAAIEAWNKAEPNLPLRGSSWVATFREVLLAAHKARNE